MLTLTAEPCYGGRRIRWMLTAAVDLDNLTKAVGGVDGGGPGFRFATFTRMITRPEVRALLATLDQEPRS
jgi:hypothetical protein